MLNAPLVVETVPQHYQHQQPPLQINKQPQQRHDNLHHVPMLAIQTAQQQQQRQQNLCHQKVLKMMPNYQVICVQLHQPGGNNVVDTNTQYPITLSPNNCLLLLKQLTLR